MSPHGRPKGEFPKSHEGAPSDPWRKARSAKGVA
jgi:hypothetical protein